MPPSISVSAKYCVVAGERESYSIARRRRTLGKARKSGAVMMMEHSCKQRKLLLAMLVLACLLLPLVSSAPLSRSLSLRKNQPSANGLEVPAQDVLVGADHGEPNHGEVAARMNIEVNDYPGSGANNRHEPRSPGRV